MDIAAIHQEATAAAEKAAEDMRSRRGDGYPCGFAWVSVYDVKLSTKLGREMKKVGFSKSYEGGIQLWNPSRARVQNVDILLAGAEAYAKVLEKNGIKAYANSRLD